MWAVPLIALAFVFVHFGDRKLPKWGSAAACAIGLYAAHISYGLLQEYIVTAPYSGLPFPSISFLVTMNRVMATAFAFIVVKYIERKPLGIFGGVDAEGSVRIACLLPSLTNVAATWFQYASLAYITFPTQMIFKSMKLVPVLMCGSIFMKRHAPAREWFDAVLITAGVAAFAYYAESDASAGAVTTKGHVIGALMLLGFLLCDAVTPSLQKRAFSNSNLDAFQMMFWIGAASSLYAGAMLYFSGDLNHSIAFVMSRPDAMIDVMALSLIATLGQIFIYVTVQKHGPVVLSMVMTTRQVFSVVLSCILFGHQLPHVAIGAAALVFSVLLVRSYRSSKSESGKAVGKDGSSAAASDATSDVVDSKAMARAATSVGSENSSQMSAAFGLAKGFASKYSSKAAALTGKLRG
jgi:adenosine 3'-phospho 5'-phosphosulfate transporter B2